MEAPPLDSPPESWAQKVAAVLPLPLRASAPYTLGEAAAELALWADTASATAWGRRENRNSLFDDLDASAAPLGPRLRRLMRPHLRMLRPSHRREDLAAAAYGLVAAWREPSAIEAAFDDLVEGGRVPGVTSGELRALAAPIQSQLLEGVSGGWSVLREAATALAGTPIPPQLEAWFGPGVTLADLTEHERLAKARTIVSAGVPVGDVVVWLLYDRARAPWRVDAGEITFFQAEWMVPNARRDDGQDFEGRDEMRELLDNVWWAEELEQAVERPENHIVLVRVALGNRRAVGAVEEATRRVEAILSIAVDAGGVSWQSTGTSVIVRDGQIASSTQGRSAGPAEPAFTDTYGIGATAEALEHAASQLDASLANGPMPDRLVEALLDLREAAMTDHRDVVFYGQRPVTPRVATALEDHAVESIAAIASMTSDDFAEALDAEEIDRQVTQRLLGGLMAPLDDHTFPGTYESQRAIELAVSSRKGSRRIVRVADVMQNRDRLEAVTMTDVVRADLEKALEILTVPTSEAELRRSVADAVQLMRRRYRRVRNAVTHGNPLTVAALLSIRDFSDRTAHDALRRALGAYANQTPLSSALADTAKHQEDDRLALAAGASYLDRRRS